MRGQASAAQDGIERQLTRCLRRETKFTGRLLQGFDEQKDVGRAASGDGGHRVHAAFVVNPDGATHGLHDLFGLAFFVLADAGQGKQAGDAGTDQRRGVGHDADQLAVTAQPA